ncbi:MAG: hypothetical protein AVDCRST_MAG68-729, partial [uncultured Gemmatimonadetes bacterium]
EPRPPPPEPGAARGGGGRARGCGVRRRSGKGPLRRDPGLPVRPGGARGIRGRHGGVDQPRRRSTHRHGRGPGLGHGEHRGEGPWASRRRPGGNAPLPVRLPPRHEGGTGGAV